MSDKISIIMPCYNEQAHIRQAVQSVINQSYENWQLIAVDDASSDETPEILQSLAGEDDRIQPVFLSVSAGSAGPVRNAGMQKADGRYIAFLDADDLWMPDKLTRQIRFMRERESTLCTTHIKVISMDGDNIGTYTPPVKKADWSSMLHENVVTTSAMVVDYHAYPDIRFPDIKRTQDYACWMDLLRDGGEVHVMPEQLTKYRVSPQNFWQSKPRQLYYRWHVHRKYLKRTFLQTIYDMMFYIFKGVRKTRKSLKA